MPFRTFRVGRVALASLCVLIGSSALGKTFNRYGLSFSYPSSWTLLDQSQELRDGQVWSTSVTLQGNYALFSVLVECPQTQLVEEEYVEGMVYQYARDLLKVRDTNSVLNSLKGSKHRRVLMSKTRVGSKYLFTAPLEKKLYRFDFEIFDVPLGSGSITLHTVLLKDHEQKDADGVEQIFKTFKVLRPAALKCA